MSGGLSDPTGKQRTLATVIPRIRSRGRNPQKKRPIGAAVQNNRRTVTGKTAKMLRKLLERVKGIEPSSQAWEAHILPLNHTRAGETDVKKVIAEGGGRNGGVGAAAWVRPQRARETTGNKDFWRNGPSSQSKPPT